MILVLPSTAWDAERLLALLGAPDAQEWRDRVGVVGRVDGSAKSSTRLLAARGWVLKTRLDESSPSKAEVLARVVHARAAGIRAGLWHPDKQWAVFRAGGLWFPLTVCPELCTLRRLPTLEQRMESWTRMMVFAIAVARAHGVGLDLNPANFALAEALVGPLYYVDDELYPVLREPSVAGALVARIPEEPEASREAWATWGRRLREQLARECAPLVWSRVCEEALRYPVTEQFEASRQAMVDGMRQRRPLRVARSSESSFAAGRLTCVLADVHANLPALEAVLAQARLAGVDSYLFLGDAVGYGPHPAQCIERLAGLPAAVLLRGNHDHAIASGELELGMNGLARTVASWTRGALDAAALEWLAKLGLEHAADGWLAVHGAPKDPRRLFAYVYELTYEDNLAYLKSAALRLCFHGHSHLQLVHAELPTGAVKLRSPPCLDLGLGQPLLINPGSVGQPRDGDPRAAFALWDRARDVIDFRRVAYDLERTARDLRAAGLPEQLERRLRAGA